MYYPVIRRQYLQTHKGQRMKTIHLDKSDLPEEWLEPSWFKEGETTLPVWLINWASRSPCDMLCLGSESSLLTIYMLLRHFWSGHIEKVTPEDFWLYRDFNEERRMRDIWGGTAVPTHFPVLFIFDVIYPMKPQILASLQSIVRLRRSKNKLTIVHSPLSLTEWDKEIKILFPMVVTDGTT